MYKIPRILRGPTTRGQKKISPLRQRDVNGPPPLQSAAIQVRQKNRNQPLERRRLGRLRPTRSGALATWCVLKPSQGAWPASEALTDLRQANTATLVTPDNHVKHLRFTLIWVAVWG